MKILFAFMMRVIRKKPNAYCTNTYFCNCSKLQILWELCVDVPRRGDEADRNHENVILLAIVFIQRQVYRTIQPESA